jgi:hypothetical protein
MGTRVIVVVLPLPQFVVEQVNVVGRAALVQELVELLVVDPMGAFDFAIEMRRRWPDVDMADIQALHMPVELRLKLGAIVGLNDMDAKREPAHDVVEEVSAFVVEIIETETP